MSHEENILIISRIQYFYDVMRNEMSDMQRDALNSIDDIENLTYTHKFNELKFLITEYSKVFDPYLYRPPIKDE